MLTYIREAIEDFTFRYAEIIGSVLVLLLLAAFMAMCFYFPTTYDSPNPNNSQPESPYSMYRV